MNFFSCLILIFPIFLGSYVNANIVKAVFLPKPNNTYPRIIMRGSLPNMGEVTVCHWANAHSAKPMYVLSYAHGRADDEIRTGIDVENSQMLFSIRNQATSSGNSGATLGGWHHFCYLWSNGGGTVNFYKDGRQLSGSKRDVQTGLEVRGGGMLILGQEQDVYNGKFDINESWEGFISDVQIWDEVLPESQIAAIASCKLKLEGNIFSWMKTPVSAMEGVIFSSSNLCKG